MHRAQSVDRESSLFVARGLYVLRYDASATGLEHPLAIVRAAPGHESSVQIVSAPGRAPGQLDGPGAALVIRASEHGNLQIGIRRTREHGSLDAALKLESVGSFAEIEAHGATSGSRSEERAPSSVRPAEILFVAHVARRGDVVLGPNQWAAGPDAPAPIEGLEIRPLASDGLRVEIQVMTAGRASAWSEWASPGKFVGTRGRNLPLTGLRLRLVGDEADQFLLGSDALFLGSAIANRRGREIEFVSASGRDPLVGFRFEICSERRAGVRHAVAAARDSEPRIRVFRAAAGR